MLNVSVVGGVGEGRRDVSLCSVRLNQHKGGTGDGRAKERSGRGGSDEEKQGREEGI